MYRLNRLDAPKTNSSNATSSDLIQHVEPEIGTLMWIGDRLSPEAMDVYRYCEANAPQLAYRTCMEDAIARPGTNVSQIIINRSDRRPTFENQLYQLASVYPKAILIEMFGPMWEGHVYKREIHLQTQQFYWHRWNQILPPLFGCLFRDQPAAAAKLPSQSVAIIAANFAEADPLMDLATSVGAVSVWCRSPKLITARNCSVVWWDDSAASAASEMIWRERIEAVEKNSCVRPQHVWLATAPRVQQYFRARAAGIDVVFSKPHRIEALVSTLAGYRTDLGAHSHTANRRENSLSAPSRAEIAKIKIAA